MERFMLLRPITLTTFPRHADELIEIRARVKNAFGEDATVDEDGLITVWIPHDWDNEVAICAIKGVFRNIDVRFDKPPSLRM
jgi:hypothetical protein